MFSFRAIYTIGLKQLIQSHNWHCSNSIYILWKKWVCFLDSCEMCVFNGWNPSSIILRYFNTSFDGNEDHAIYKLYFTKKLRVFRKWRFFRNSIYSAVSYYLVRQITSNIAWLLKLILSNETNFMFRINSKIYCQYLLSSDQL